MAAINRITYLTTGSPDLFTEPFLWTRDDGTGVVAPGNARQRGMLHLPLDVLDVAGSNRSSCYLYYRRCRVSLRFRKLDEAQIRDRTKFAELQCSHLSPLRAP